MSLENSERPPTDVSRLYGWHMRRATMFYDEARRLALEANHLRALWLAAVGKRRGVVDVAAASRSCRNSALYQDLCSDQALYDRWATREFAAASAISSGVIALQTKGY